MSIDIRAQGLTKKFGDRTAVAEASFDVAAGEVFGFLGPNGAGKTTTVRMLTTTLAPTAGSAEVAGLPLTPSTWPDVRRRIGVMPEAAGLYLKLSVHDNLEFFAHLYGMRGNEAERRIRNALEAVGLEARGDERAGTLSKGLRQRTALARTLVAEPRVLFLDEPTAGLDPKASREVHRLIDDLRRRGVTVFLTTHRLEEAERVCDRVAIINTRLVSVGSPEELRQALFGSGLEVRLRRPLADPGAVFDRITGVLAWREHDGAYLVEVDDPAQVAPEVTRGLVSAGADVLHLSESVQTLEETYLELIEEER